MAIVAQISDLHLGSDPVRLDRVDAVLDHIRTMPTRPDVLLVTGDVLDDPAVGDYTAIGGRLQALGIPIVACPGNHDDRARFRMMLGPEPGEAPCNSSLVLNTGLTIVACDSTVPGVDWGELDDATLTWLESELSASTTPVLFALHHPPVEVGVPFVDPLRLRRPEQLEALLRRTSATVVGIVCGHAHTPATTTFAGLPLVVCPAVSSTILTVAESVEEIAFAPVSPPGFCLHLVDGPAMTTHVRSC